MDHNDPWPWITLTIIVATLVALFIYRGIYAILEYQRIVVFSSSGKLKGVRGPGHTWVTPWLETVWRDDTDPNRRTRHLIDLREQLTPARQKVMTKDNVVCDIDPVIIYRIGDPARMVVTIKNAAIALMSITQTTLRAVVGDMTLAEVNSRREEMAAQLKDRIAPEAERWGIHVTTIDIRQIQLDPEVERAMAKRKADIEEAEAKARTSIITAEAERGAALARREALLTVAESEKRSTILRAEADREAAVLRADGMAAHYRKLVELGASADTVLRFEQVEALKRFADSPNAKIVMAPNDALTHSDGFHRVRVIEEVTPKGKERAG